MDQVTGNRDYLAVVLLLLNDGEPHVGDIHPSHANPKCCCSNTDTVHINNKTCYSLLYLWCLRIKTISIYKIPTEYGMYI